VFFCVLGLGCGRLGYDDGEPQTPVAGDEPGGGESVGVVAAQLGASEDVSIVSDGLRVAYSWQSDASGSPQIFVRGFTGGEPVQLSDSANDPRDTWIAQRGEDVVVGWQEDNLGLFLGWVEADGSVVRRLLELPSSNVPTDPSIALGGGRLGIAWQDDRGSGPQVFFALHDIDGNFVGPEYELSGPSGEGVDPVVVWNGDEFAVAWSEEPEPDNPEVFFARITDGSNPVRVSNAPGWSDEVALAWGGGQYALVWRDRRNGDADVYMAIVTPSGQGATVSGEYRVVDEDSSINDPAIAWAGDRFGLAWVSGEDPDNEEILYAPVDAAGTLLVDPLNVSSSPFDSQHPRVSYAGGEVVVAWDDVWDGANRNIVAATLGPVY
jgi:hypothetical protein